MGGINKVAVGEGIGSAFGLCCFGHVFAGNRSVI